jgi:hypothetical protein
MSFVSQTEMILSGHGGTDILEGHGRQKFKRLNLEITQTMDALLLQQDGVAF